MFAAHADLVRHLVDFGMVVVVWLVQLVIYPGFLAMEAERLRSWHRSYTFRVSFVIMPLMLLQLGLVGRAALLGRDPGDLMALAGVAVCWLLTFGVSVPLHRRVADGEGGRETLNRLIRTNWPRTVLWTAVFIIGLA
ncbi:MAG: hypothetical protein ACLFVC_04495 [Opitutales bacterium]